MFNSTILRGCRQKAVSAFLDRTFDGVELKAIACLAPVFDLLFTIEKGPSTEKWNVISALVSFENTSFLRALD